MPEQNETPDTMIISRAEYQQLQETIKRQEVEIAALDYRIKTILGQ